MPAVERRVDVKHGGFVLNRSYHQRYRVSHLHLLLPGTVPKDSPCWRNTPLKVVGNYSATRERNGKYVLWSVDEPASFAVESEEMPGHLNMTFQRGIPGGYYRGENHPVMMEVTLPIGQGLECRYSSAGRHRQAKSKRPVASSAAAATSTTSQQECARAAVATQPEVKKTEIRDAGKPGEQDMYAQVFNEAFECGEQFDVVRAERFRFRVGDPKHPGRMITFLFPGYSLLTKSANQGLSIAHQVADKVGKHDNEGLYKCSPGPRITPAEFGLKIRAIDPHSGKVLATRVYKTPITKIFPHRC